MLRIQRRLPLLPSLIPIAGANTTWWGVYATQPATTLLQLPDCGFGALLSWVGKFKGTVSGACPETRWSVQQVGSLKQLVPSDLFKAQRAKQGLRPPS